MSTPGGYHEYIKGCSVHWGDTMMHEYTGGCSVRRKDTMMHVGGYHVYIRGCSLRRGFQYKSKAFINLLPHIKHDIPPMYSWYPSNLLNIP